MKITKYFYFNLSLALPLLILFISLFITYQAFSAAKIDLEQKTQTYFDFRVREAINLIKNRIDVYDQLLHGASGLFVSSNSVERNEFKRYIATLNLAKNHAGLQGMGFSLIVPTAKKTQHIASIRSEGLPKYTIWPEGQRDIYTTVIYLEPFEDRNLRAFGYDMFSEPVRHTAMQKAIDTGLPQLSGKITLVQETGKQEQAGFLMYLPIYSNDTHNDTQAERQEHILGWVYSSFRMNDLMAGLFGERANDLHIQIFDGENMSNEALMYDSDNTYIATTTQIETTQRLQITDHSWTVHIRPLPLMNSRIRAVRPIFVATTGIIISVFFTLLIWFLVTGRERAINAANHLRTERQRLNSILEGTRSGTWEWNVQTGEVVFNDYWANIIGYEHSELEPVSIETWLQFLHPDDAKLSGEILEKHFSGELAYYECEVRMQHKNGLWIWVLDRGKVTTWTPDGKPLLMFGTHQEITERKKNEDELRIAADKIKQLAFYDQLTQLPNRRLLLDRINQALIASSRSSHHGALLFIDLDYFKTLNDTHGHDMGDMLLQHVAARLTACVREGDTVARLGGDEFVVLLEDLSEQNLEAGAQAQELIEKILSILNQPYQLGRYSHHSDSSIGATLFNGHKQLAEELLKQADIAMYQSKAAGRNTLRFFDKTMQEAITVRADMQKELRKAIEHNQFQLYYQIQVDHTGQALGAEVLIRWQHPERGMISPFDFIPLAEETGLILPIGQWVLDTACAQLALWQQNPLTQHLIIAVNVSAKQFHQDDFEEHLLATIARHDINTARLKLELTEGILVANIDDIIIKMDALSRIGIQFSLDDFGTGYSSLQYLKKLPLNQLKIDQSFVRDIVTKANDRAIVRTIITMAHSLGINVIAEGVETEDQRQFLLDNGCMYFQGYLFSKPVLIDEFEALLKKADCSSSTKAREAQFRLA
jgi:diguanylate cyclase (GGDEF)-like protein/PAS domain S-box-containing protein